MDTNNRSAAVKTNLKLFGSTRVMVICAMLIAISIIGKSFRLDVASVLRISFENLPILMAGIFFGPFIGAAVGLGADLIGCMVTSQAPIPLITVGAVCVGFVSGFVAQKMSGSRLLPRVAWSVGLAHLIGSVIVKTAALYLAFPGMRPTLIWRPVNYIVIAAVEGMVIYLLLSNKAFAEQVRKLCSK